MRLENSSKLLLLGISPKSHLLRTDDMLASCVVFSLSEEFAEEDSDEYTAPCKEDPRHMLEILLEHVVLLDNRRQRRSKLSEPAKSRLIAKIAWCIQRSQCSGFNGCLLEPSMHASMAKLMFTSNEPSCASTCFVKENNINQ